MERNDRSVTISLLGPLADAGPLDIAIIFPIVTAFRDALREMIRYQWGDESSGGRPTNDLRAASALKLVAIKTGSYEMTAEIAILDSARRSSDAPLVGLNALLTGAASGTMPEAVSKQLRKMESCLPDGIDTATITGGPSAVKFMLHRQNHGVPQRQRKRETAQYGRLMEIDWARRTAELHSPFGVTRLVFPERLQETMQNAARKYVEIIGSGILTPDGWATSIDVDDVAPLDDGIGHTSSPTAEELSSPGEFDPFDFDHPDWIQDDALDTWVENILNGKYEV